MGVKSKYRINISDLPFIPISHGTANKKVFCCNSSPSRGLSQVAYSVFQPGDSCDRHAHPIMDEDFFVLSGSGKYAISDEELDLNSGDFIKISAGINYKLDNTTDDILEMVYFGIIYDQ